MSHAPILRQGRFVIPPLNLTHDKLWQRCQQLDLGMLRRHFAQQVICVRQFDFLDLIPGQISDPAI